MHQAVLVACILLGLEAQATNYYVNESTQVGDIYTTAVGNNTNDGLSPSTPKADLTTIWTTYGPAGTNVLAAGDTVFVDAGIYYQTERDLYLTVPIVVSGAGMDKTIFDNDDAGITGYGFVRLGAGVHLENFKIWRYGRQNTYAHAIHVEAGVTNVQIEAIHIDDCGRDSGLYPVEIFAGAEVDFIGGGATCNTWLQSGGVRIQGSTTDVDFYNYLFYENSRGSDDGAALRIDDGNVSIYNTLFEGNQCNNGGVSIVYMNTGSLEIYDSEFKNNRYLYSFAEYGGTILVNGGTFYMTRSVITGTTKIGSSSAYGAGACFDGTTGTINAQIDSCYFASNDGGRGNDLHAKRSNTTVTVFETTFASSADQVGTSTSGTIVMSNSGDPSVYTNTGSTTKTNTTAPSYTAIPDVPQYTGTCGAVTILPVELYSFEGMCAGDISVFQWITLSEVNNDYFELLFSEDGSNWTTLEVIQGAGNSQQTQLYRIELQRNESGYYALRQTNFDGTSMIFSPIWLTSCGEQNTPRAHFDSNKQLVRFFGAFTPQEYAICYFYNSMGQLISQGTCRDKNGTLEYDLPGIASGVYTYKLQLQDRLIAGKVFVH